MNWFGSVPAHWSTPPVYARYEVQLGKMLDERKITKRFLAPYLRNTDVQWDGINVDDLPEMDFDENERKLYALRAGDILMCEGGEIGRCAIWDSDRQCFYQKALHRLRPITDNDDPRYFILVMRAAVEAGLFTSRASAATIQHLPAEKLRIVRYPAPPIEEQRAIVEHVSRLTLRLDALLRAKQRLLDLLAEKRKAITATSVMRGLDPKAKLRDSGVPWLGEVPAHWEIERARWLFRERDDRSQTGDEELLTVSHLTGVTPRSEKDVNMFEAETNEGYKLCEPGDLVINTLWAWMGAMGVVPVKGIVSPAYNVYEPGTRLVPSYIDALVRLPVFAQEVTRYSKGVWSSRLRLYPEDFFKVYLPVPPKEEQHAIVDHIARETAKLDAIRAATERTMALLKERRSALVAAAVTGQLKIGVAA
ncbi:restriction endonuclease subunit S [Burkholderia cepacia]|uniref:restriction endonuclease subunit S n=1 Tax=Burkholderia cepacia TaxID=292 RepID=UPI000AEAB699|nr:restriction endonuclease subunit S [Burkholderia cepacia]